MKKIDRGKYAYEIHVSWKRSEDVGTNGAWGENYLFHSEEPLSNKNHSAIFAGWEREFRRVRPEAVEIDMQGPVDYGGYGGNGMR